MTTDSIEKVVITGAGLTISRLIWNRFQRPMPGLLGGIYDLNPGLADVGPDLPIGTVVMIPVPVQSDGEEVVEMITLWD